MIFAGVTEPGVTTLHSTTKVQCPTIAVVIQVQLQSPTVPIQWRPCHQVEDTQVRVAQQQHRALAAPPPPQNSIHLDRQ